MRRLPPSFPLSALDRQIRYGQERDAFDEPLLADALRNVRMGIADQFEKEQIEERVRQVQDAELSGRLPPFRKSGQKAGSLALGFEYDRTPISCDHEILNEGVLLVGNTGSTKTNLVQLILRSLVGGGIKIWVADMYKPDMRHLRPLLQARGKDLVVLRKPQWRFNTLQAGRVDPHVHLGHQIDLMIRVLGLPSHSQTILQRCVHELYAEFGIWNGRRDAWPCWFDVREWLKDHAGEINAAARDASLARFDQYLLAMTPKCPAYRLAWNPTDLAEHSIVFEMRETGSERVKLLMLSSLLFGTFENELRKGIPSCPFRLFMVFEDSQRLLDSLQNSSNDVAPFDEITGVIWASGIGLCVVAQTSKGLSERLIPNLSNKIIGRLGSDSDASTMGANLSLGPDQIEYCKRRLDRGRFVVQLSQGRREPFVLEVPKLERQHIVTDEEADESVKALAHLPIVPATEYANWVPHPVATIRSNSGTKERGSVPNLTAAEIEFLRLVVTRPGQKSSAYARNLNGKRATKIRARLVELGLVREHELSISKRGRPAIVLEPLKAGIDLIAGQVS